MIPRPVRPVVDPGGYVSLPTSPAGTLTAQVADILTYDFPQFNGLGFRTRSFHYLSNFQ
jgi:hypothetical protein